MEGFHMWLRALTCPFKKRWLQDVWTIFLPAAFKDSAQIFFSLLPYSRWLLASEVVNSNVLQFPQNCARSQSGVAQTPWELRSHTMLPLNSVLINSTKSDMQWKYLSPINVFLELLARQWDHAIPSRVTYGIFNAAPAIRQIRLQFMPRFHGDPPSSWPRFKTWLISSRLSLSCVPLLHKDHTDVVSQGEIHL